MTKYVYIHGFNSAFSRENPKIAQLETIGEVIGVTYDTLASYEVARAEIIAQLPDELFDVVLIGTSLGGFWAADIGRELGLPAVLINPSTNPGVTLERYAGQIFTNYITDVTAEFTREAFESYALASIKTWDYYRFRPLVLLDEGDEVISADETYEKLVTFLTYLFPGGSHRFDHMEQSLDLIRAYAIHCQTQ